MKHTHTHTHIHLCVAASKIHSSLSLFFSFLLQEDLQLLDTTLPQIKKLTIQLRVTEKRILQGALEYVEQWIKAWESDRMWIFESLSSQTCIFIPRKMNLTMEYNFFMDLLELWFRNDERLNTSFGEWLNVYIYIYIRLRAAQERARAHQ